MLTNLSPLINYKMRNTACQVDWQNIMNIAVVNLFLVLSIRC